jgi:hypothetical protein
MIEARQLLRHFNAQRVLRHSLQRNANNVVERYLKASSILTQVANISPSRLPQCPKGLMRAPTADRPRFASSVHSRFYATGAGTRPLTSSVSTNSTNSTKDNAVLLGAVGGSFFLTGILLHNLQEQAENNALATEIDQLAQAAVNAGESPGLQVAVYKNGKPVLVKGYGDANDDSIFRIGSITKQFVAAAILKLQEEGELSVDDKLSKYYPDYPGAENVTLKQMLHQISGLHDYNTDRKKTDKNETKDWIGVIGEENKEKEPYFTPGTSFAYTNINYLLLGGIVEQLEGKPLAAVLKDRFFTPLGLTQTALDDETQIIEGLIAGHEGQAPGKFKDPEPFSTTLVGGAGAVCSTANDLALWNAALHGGKVFLKPESLEEMTAPGTLNDGKLSSNAMGDEEDIAEYGCGLWMNVFDGHAKISHSGAVPGFSSFLAEFPNDQITLVVLANSRDSKASTGVRETTGVMPVTERIERVVLGLPPEEGKEK